MTDKTVAEKPTVEEVEAAGPWHHKITFGCGVTVGTADAYAKYKRMTVGVELAKKKVWDVGAMSGIGTLYLEEQGATVYPCEIMEIAFKQFDLVKREFGIKASLEARSVYEIAKKADVVFLGGLYYHLQHPRLGLEKAWEATKEVMVLDGAFIEGEDAVCRFEHHKMPPGEYLPQYALEPATSLMNKPTQACLRLWIDALPGDKRIVDVRTAATAHNRLEWQVWRT